MTSALKVREEEILARLALVIGGAPVESDPAVIHNMMLDQLVDKEVVRASSPIHGRDKAEILAELKGWTWSEQIIDFRLRVGQHGDGFGANPDGLTLRKLIDEYPSGADFGPLVPRFPDAIKTISGTVELAPQPVLDDLVRHAAAFAALGEANEQMVLIGRRHLKTVNSWMHNLNILIKGKTDCTLQVHPDDATRLGLADGGAAHVQSRVGKVTAPVEVTDEVMPGVVCLPHGWGYDEDGIEMHTAKTKPGVNSNALTDDTALDALSGNCALNGIPVEVTAA